MGVSIPITVWTVSVAVYVIGFLMLSAVVIYDESTAVNSDYAVAVLFAALWPLIGLHYIYYQMT